MNATPDNLPQDDATGRGRPASLARIRALTVIVLLVCFLCVIIEGLSSAALSIYELVSYTARPEISQYDRFLGWVDIPDANIPDAFGPGKYVRTNSLGFRNANDLSSTEGAPKVRIICSGDSFTFGQGVANDHAWCNRLPLLNGGLETINMAQPGYGVDQMYLRYRRDGIGIRHSIHLFAFIVGDFDRMGSRDQHEYGKPVLSIAGDALKVQNVPVPHLRWTLRRLLDRGGFRTVEFIERGIAKLSRNAPSRLTSVDRLGPLASRVLQTVQSIDEENNVVPVFVLLPTRRDLREDSPWRKWITKTAGIKGWLFVDLTPALRAVPAGTAASFFIPPGSPDVGHYTEAGNEWVERTLYRQLTEIPKVNMRLRRTASNERQP